MTTTNTETNMDDVAAILDVEIQRVMDAAPRLDYVKIPLQVAAKCRALAAQERLSSRQPDLVEAIAESVKQQVDDGEGFWHICSGCTGTDNPHSDLLGCEVGMGCRECGGLGAVWDDTDYAGLAHIPNEAIEPRANDQTAPDAGLVAKLTSLFEMRDTGNSRRANKMIAAVVGQNKEAICTALSRQDGLLREARDWIDDGDFDIGSPGYELVTRIDAHLGDSK